MARQTAGDDQYALNFAYMYGYPLLEFGKYVATFPSASANTIYHDRQLSTSSDLKVIRPNVDTLYSTVFVDLSSHDLAFTVPDIKDRYWVWPFYDPYGNVIGEIGSLQGHQPGKWLVRFADKDFGINQGSPQGINGYVGYINFPAAYGILLGRIATTPTAADQELANQCQDEARVDSVKRNVEPIAPPLDLSMLTLPEHRPSDKASIPQAVLRLTAALASYNQSPVLQDRPWIADLLTRSGIKNKVFTCPNNVDLSGGPKYAETQGRAALNADKIDLGNNWSLNFPSCQGTFGSHYAARYYIAKRGYLALTTEQAIYPSLKGHLQIGANEAILLRFSRKPALIPSGFWSLTAYNRAQYLISNEQNRYCIGDRDNMTFVDGTPLGDGSKDGEFCILLQPADVTPPAKWRCNWLPLPAGGGEFSITVRWYGAKKEMYMALTNEFVPKFEWTKAITDSRESKL